MIARLSSPQHGRSNRCTWAALGPTVLVLTGGSPSTAASPIMTSMSATTDNTDALQGQGHGYDKGQGKGKVNVSQAFDRQVEEAIRFMRTAPDGSTYFDTDAAHAANADPTILEMGAVIDQLAASQQPAPESQMSSLEQARPSGATGAAPATVGVQPWTSLTRSVAPTTGAADHAAISRVPATGLSSATSARTRPA